MKRGCRQANARGGAATTSGAREQYYVAAVNSVHAGLDGVRRTTNDKGVVVVVSIAALVLPVGHRVAAHNGGGITGVQPNRARVDVGGHQSVARRNREDIAVGHRVQAQVGAGDGAGTAVGAGGADVKVSGATEGTGA